MSKSDELSDFVREAALAGRSRGDISGALLEAGWSRQEVTEALSHWVDTSQGLLTPRPHATVSARDFLFYMIQFGALLLAAIYVTLTLLRIIDMTFHDDAPRRYMNGLRYYIASVIVFTPVYLWMTNLDVKAMRANEARRRSAIRKWLVAIILFVAAATFLGDLVWVIYTLLKGDFYGQAALKALVVAAVSGGVFAVYRAELRQET